MTFYLKFKILIVVNSIFCGCRDNVLKHVKVGHKEKRDLIMLRNRLVHFLSSNKVVSDTVNSYIPTLPEPINHHSACSKCPYLTVCSAVLR